MSLWMCRSAAVWMCRSAAALDVSLCCCTEMSLWMCSASMSPSAVLKTMSPSLASIETMASFHSAVSGDSMMSANSVFSMVLAARRLASSPTRRLSERSPGYWLSTSFGFAPSKDIKISDRWDKNCVYESDSNCTRCDDRLSWSLSREYKKTGGRKPGCPGVYHWHTTFFPTLWYKYIYVCPAIPATRKVTVTTLTQCVACPANSHSEEGSGHITKCVCNIGWLGYDGGPCEQCPLGKYTVFISNWEAECSNCPAGQYSPVLGIGITSCQNCMKGTYSTADAAICTSCPTNSDSFETSTVQSACICNAGSTGSDGETCSECARGKFKLYNGSAACEECPPETFQARSGATHCTQCRANSYSLQGSIAALSCAPAMLATVR